MCLSCGCGTPNDSHGDDRNITLERLEESARAANITSEQAVNNINETMRASGSQRQTGQA